MQFVIVALLTCTALGGCDWPWWHDMHDPSSPSASRGPRSPVSGSIPVLAQGPFDRIAEESVANPLSSDASAAGQALYQQYCVPCHGGPVEKYFPPMPPLSSIEVQRHGDGWLYATITSGTELMPAYGHELDPRERWQIVAFVRTMAR